MTETDPFDEFDNLTSEFRTEIKAMQKQLSQLFQSPALLTDKLDRLRSLAADIARVRELVGDWQREAPAVDLEKLEAAREAVRRRLLPHYWDFIELGDGSLISADDLCAKDELALAAWEARGAAADGGSVGAGEEGDHLGTVVFCRRDDQDYGPI